MSIVTKTGDQGETSLMFGRRVSKSDARVEASGCVDELTAALGLVRSICDDKFVADQIFAAQKDLIILMGELSTLPEDDDRYLKEGFHRTSAEMVDRITNTIVELEKDKALYPKDWVIPGGTPISAAFDFARVTCRRAERQVAELESINPEVIRYLNRLSDFCWILARYMEKQSKIGQRKSANS